MSKKITSQKIELINWEGKTFNVPEKLEQLFNRYCIVMEQDLEEIYYSEDFERCLWKYAETPEKFYNKFGRYIIKKEELISF